MQERLDVEKTKKGIAVALLIGILTVSIIIALTFRADTLIALSEIDGRFLALAFASVGTSWVFSGLAFLVLTKIINRPIGFFASAKVYLGGSFLGFVTPFGSGLLPAQIVILTSEGLTAGQATAVVSSRATISSWLFAALSLLIFLIFRAELPQYANASLLGIAAVAFVWSLITLFFIKRPVTAKNAIARICGSRRLVLRVGAVRIEAARDRFFHEIDHLSSNLKDLFSLQNAPAIFLVFLIEVVAWFALFVILPLILFGFGIEGNLGQLIFRIFLLFSIAPASPTPGGSGVVEAAFTGLLLDLVPRSIIGLVVLVWRALTYYLTLLAGGAVMLKFIASSAFTRRSE